MILCINAPMSSVAHRSAEPSHPAPKAGRGAHKGAQSGSHGHPHGAGPRRGPQVPAVSALRASLGARLAVVAVLCGIMWTAIVWVVS